MDELGKHSAWPIGPLHYLMIFTPFCRDKTWQKCLELNKEEYLSNNEGLLGFWFPNLNAGCTRWYLMLNTIAKVYNTWKHKDQSILLDVFSGRVFISIIYNLSIG